MSSVDAPADTAVDGRGRFWELEIFALCVWIVYGLIVFDPNDPTDVSATSRA